MAMQYLQLKEPKNVQITKIPLNKLDLYKKYSTVNFDTLDEDEQKNKKTDPSNLNRKMTLVEGNWNSLSWVSHYKKLEILELACNDIQVTDFDFLLEMPNLKLILFEHVSVNYEKLYKIADKINAKIMIHPWHLPVRENEPAGDKFKTPYSELKKLT
jgi:hypothetical protein